MSGPAIRFDDGAAYERMMGRWSRLAGEVFVDWLAPPRGGRWLDVGCGNGAFTELVSERCAPASVDGIDPSEGQLAFARTRPATRSVNYRQGDAMALPYADDGFDVVVMALVIFFVPDPVKAVAEMTRVVRPGGTVAAYAWDMHGGGFPLDAQSKELRAMGVPAPKPPSVDASRLPALQSLWTDAGLADVETRQIVVHRTFADFDDLWMSGKLSASMGAIIDKLSPGQVDHLKAHLRATHPADAGGTITHGARANAVKGRLPR